MEQKDIARINELARKAKSEGLSEEEKIEQARLRQAYVAEFRKNLEAQLNSTIIVEPDGTRHKLTPKERTDLN
ncbi:MAG: DUF896 domain-containing protein [Oscillospiraceae bacterium]|jgi:uncharacterized protein YnzC (UPF0291/DUF896 family)|nr:DUF896 domain-containing protein [Oscillospiraceae bacterium]